MLDGRVSLDTKATVKVGPFSRGGYNRREQSVCDHDFQPAATLTPFGILLPESGDNDLWFTDRETVEVLENHWRRACRAARTSRSDENGVVRLNRGRKNFVLTW